MNILLPESWPVWNRCFRWAGHFSGHCGSLLADSYTQMQHASARKNSLQLWCFEAVVVLYKEEPTKGLHKNYVEHSQKVLYLHPTTSSAREYCTYFILNLLSFFCIVCCATSSHLLKYIGLCCHILKEAKDN